MRRTWIDALMSAGALMVLLLALVSMDHRVRGTVTFGGGAAASSHLTATGSRLQESASTLVRSVGDACQAHPVLTMVVGAAVVLVWAMGRTSRCH